MLDQKIALELLDKNDRETLIKEYEVIIYHYLHKFNLWNTFKSQRDDFLQEGRLAILKALSLYDRRTKLSTYVHSSVRNAMFNYIKKMKLYSTIGDLEYNDYDDNDIVDGETPSVETLTLHDEVMKLILRHKHRHILQLYFIDQKSQSEIGKMKGISQQRVAKIINNFRKEARALYGNKQ